MNDSTDSMPKLVEPKKFSFTYDGPALEDGSIDAALLSKSINGLVLLVREANFNLYGDATKLTLNISAHKHGSFTTEFVAQVSVISSMLSFFASSEVSGISNILGILGFIKDNPGVLELYRKTEGRPLAKEGIILNPNGTVQIGTVNGSVTVTNNVFNLYNSPAVQKGLEDIVSPLLQPGIETANLSLGGKTEETLTRQDAEFVLNRRRKFENESVSYQELDLQIAKFGAPVTSPWTLTAGPLKVIAKILDKEFIGKIDSCEIRPGLSDTLKVRLRVIEQVDLDGESTKYEVERVLSHKSFNNPQLTIPLK